MDELHIVNLFLERLFLCKQKHFMRSEYRKLKTIMKKNLNVDFSKNELQKNLSTDFGFANWEVDYLLAKVETEFNINLAALNDTSNVTVNHLLQQIRKPA